MTGDGGRGGDEVVMESFEGGQGLAFEGDSRLLGRNTETVYNGTSPRERHSIM
jgi:hypothetical protein